MSYNAIDLIDKAIDIGIKREKKYEEISKKKSDIPSLKVISKALIKEIDISINYYKNLKEELINSDLDEIDFVIYDKISFLINEYNKKIYFEDINNPKDFLKFSLDLEEDMYSLFVDIQGRFVKSQNDTNTKTYVIITQLINQSSKLKNELKKLVK